MTRLQNCSVAYLLISLFLPGWASTDTPASVPAIAAQLRGPMMPGEVDPAADPHSASFLAAMREVEAGWNAGDARRAAAVFTEDAVYSEPPDKQLYRGCDALFRFFGGEQGRKGAMQMQWHHLAFDSARGVGSVNSPLLMAAQCTVLPWFACARDASPTGVSTGTNRHCPGTSLRSRIGSNGLRCPRDITNNE